ncbi:MAG: DeoR family fructose operon transcriptional repressor, partial [Oceanospirillaceae bacterium]
LDCGSTIFRICPFIRNKEIHVITNSLPIINELIGSTVKLNLVGGEMDMERQAVHGKVAVEHINRYRADKAFVGVGGFSVKNGLSASSESEVETAIAFMQNAKESYILCDKTKLETDRYFPYLPIENVANLITNDSLDEDLKNQYKENRVNIL